MNFDQIIEALGLEKLAMPSARGGTQTAVGGQPAGGTGPKPQPQQPGPPGPETAEEEPAESPEGDSGATDPPADDEDAGNTNPDVEDVTDGAIEEIRHEIDQVSADVSSNESTLRGIQSHQEEVLERLETIEEHNSQLLGVYDRLTAGINPFGENWEVRYDRARENAENAEHRYNVIEPPAKSDQDPVTPDDGESGATVREEDEHGDDEPVGFDDLLERDSDAASSDDAPTAEPSPAETAEPTPRAPANLEDSDAYLATLSSGYATEVLLMEWLTVLIDIAGSSGALKALDYYENIGWISRSVKYQMEDFLAGAHVPADESARLPGDLSTEEHNHSFTYIMKLTQQRQSPPNAYSD